MTNQKKRGTNLLLLANPVCRSLKERRTLDNNIALIENRCQLLMKKFINKIEMINFSCQPDAGKSIMVFQFLYNKESPISGYDATIARLCSTPSPDPTLASSRP
ncbi:MAG: hypothetical protein V7K57_24540 [Nostoc sp.]